MKTLDSLTAQVARLMASGDVAAARAAWDAASVTLGASETADAGQLLAEIEERTGDQLWFADLPGSGPHYRAAQHLLMPRAAVVRDEREAMSRQLSWTRIAAKLLYGTGPDGCRRRDATGEPHPHGCPPPPAASEPAAITLRDEPPVAATQPEPDQAPLSVTDSPAPPAPSTTPPPIASLLPAADDFRYGHLVPGRCYRLADTFIDFDGQACTAGERVVYRGYNYFPYDEGLTLHFDERDIRLCGLFDDQRGIMDSLDHYLVEDP